MISLARLTLSREWRRFLPAVLTVGFAGLLVLMQLILLLGIFRTISVSIDQSAADLWVGYPGTKSVDLARNLSARNEVFLRSHQDVMAVEPYLWSNGDLRRSDGSAALATVIGIDPQRGALALAHALTHADRCALDEPDTVLVDVSSLDNLRTRVGDRLELNGRRVKVVGLTHGLNSIGGANIVTSLATARAVTPGNPGDPDTVSYFLVKLRDPVAAARIRCELAPPGTTPPYSLWTAAEFSKVSQLYWMLESGLGIGFVFSGVIGLLIGIVITSQTLKAAVQNSIREYATLRALGVSVRSLRLVVLEQSAWVGIAGTAITSLIAAAAVHLATANDVLVAAPWWAFAGTSVFMFLIAVTSGALALRVLSQSEPATLLR
jgi:putative ABC transport system permease protein